MIWVKYIFTRRSKERFEAIDVVFGSCGAVLCVE